MNDKTQEDMYGTGSSCPRKADFLFPLGLPPAVRCETNPLLTRLFRVTTDRPRLPPGTADLGTSAGSRPSPIDDLILALPANLLVLFVLQEMENEIISGGGVSTPCWATWKTHGLLATDEVGGPFSLPVPGPGAVWPIDHANVIYQGLITDGCGTTPDFPVEFHSEVGEMEDLFDDFDKIGEFSAVDDTTIQPNGFWTFAYTIRATGTNGGVSDFKFRGTVSVTCSLLASL